MGFAAVRFATDVLGISLFPWQRWLFVHAMELLPDRRFRFRTVIVLVARQNGKTTWVEAKNLFKMFVLGVPTVLGTAQNLDISEESWDNAVDMVEAIPELNAEKAGVDRRNGKRSLRLVNGSRWKVAAASRKGGRGLSGDDVNLDELREHKSWLSWGAITKTTMARRNAQIYGTSNAGDDESVVLNDLQDKARQTVDDPAANPALGLFEWSAPYDYAERVYPPMDDRAGWAMSNPSLGYPDGVSEEALESALGTDPESIYRTECLCQRVPGVIVREWQVIPQQAWLALADPRSELTDPVAFAADATPDQGLGSIAVAGRREDGLLHVEVVDHRPGTAWMHDRLLELHAKWKPCAVVVDPKRQANTLIPGLEAEGVEVVKTTARDMAQACGQFFEAVTDSRTLRHLGQPELDGALARATKRDLEGAWAWDGRTGVDISPLVAVTLAAWGHSTRAHLVRTFEPLVTWR